MTKPNTTFKLSIRDVEIIEQALRAKAGRRGLAIAQGETSPQLKQEMNELQEVLGRIHEQKEFYAKFKDGKQPYVSGWDKMTEEDTIKLFKEIKKINLKLNQIEQEQKLLNEKLGRHIEFIDKTYEGLKNPIETARRFLGR